MYQNHMSGSVMTEVVLHPETTFTPVRKPDILYSKNLKEEGDIKALKFFRMKLRGQEFLLYADLYGLCYAHLVSFLHVSNFICSF
jgi:hypothetical protein